MKFKFNMTSAGISFLATTRRILPNYFSSGGNWGLPCNPLSWEEVSPCSKADIQSKTRLLRIYFKYEILHLTVMNTTRSEQNGWHFANHIFRHIFLKENLSIFISISRQDTNIFCDVNAIENIDGHEKSYLFWPQYVNSLTPKRCGNNFKSAISEHMLWIKLTEQVNIGSGNDLGHQATSHYLNQVGPVYIFIW